MDTVKGITFDNNLTFKWGFFKEIYKEQHPIEIVFDEWLRRFCNMWLKEEFKLQIGADYYQRTPTRLAYSLGYYKRRLITKRGILKLDVPRAEKMRLKFSLFERYKRYRKDFEDIVLDSLLLGHSTRKARIFFKKILGKDTISHQFASSLLRKFDFEIEKWKRRKIDKEVEILVLDALYLKGSITAIKRTKPILFAYAVYKDGKEEVLDFEISSSESINNWLLFLNKLYFRGLHNPKFIVRDDNESLKQAIAIIWPDSLQQYCIYHLIIENFKKKLKNLKNKQLKEKILYHLKWLYEAKDKEEFLNWLNKFLRLFKSYKDHPAFKYLLNHLEETIQFYKLPLFYRVIGKTTNRLERLFKEIKRRIKVFSRFPNSLSCQRWIYALITEGLIPKYRGASLIKEYNSKIKSPQFS
ncbi:MAG: IS256 family transposase [Candidatus Omnitrophica bacterium]|nr:IS256 family transposase [Candidatus Omnitrophota bacterium]